MKKILLLASLFVLVISSQVQAQTVQNLTSSFGNASDTVVNATTHNMTSPVLRGYYKAVKIQFVTTKISGTLGGTATLQESLDGTNFYTVTGASAFTITDVATQTSGWVVTDAATKYYRIQFVGVTGPMSNIVTGKIYALKSTP